MAIRGSCLCGAVSYEITGSFKVIGHRQRSALQKCGVPACAVPIPGRSRRWCWKQSTVIRARVQATRNPDGRLFHSPEEQDHAEDVPWKLSLWCRQVRG